MDGRMFEGFTAESCDFFWDLAFHNERPWFKANKERFDRCLGGPFKALGEETLALMRERFPAVRWRVHISRIYRDARRLFGRGPYQDNLWFSIEEAERPLGPGFWFEINGRGFLSGMGLFDLSPSQMDAFRRALDANPARFECLAGPIAREGRFQVVGEEYKRPKAQRDGVLGQWYNRKWVGLERRGNFEGELFDPRLPELLAADYEELMPMYEFLAEFCRGLPPRP